MLADDEKDTSVADNTTFNLTSSTWRNSIHGFFRGSSTSPDRSLRTGTAHVATAAVLGHNHQANSLKTSFATSNSGHGQGVVHLVRVNEFADSDSSQNSIYTEEEIRSAENIYAIIREYEDTLFFRFEEAFLSDSDGDGDEAATKATRFTEAPLLQNQKVNPLKPQANAEEKEVRGRSIGLGQRRASRQQPIPPPLPTTSQALSQLIASTRLSPPADPKASTDSPASKVSEKKESGVVATVLLPKTPNDQNFSVRTPSSPTYPEPNVTPLRSSLTKEENVVDIEETPLGSVDTPLDIMDSSEYPLDTTNCTEILLDSAERSKVNRDSLSSTTQSGGTRGSSTARGSGNSSNRSRGSHASRFSRGSMSTRDSRDFLSLSSRHSRDLLRHRSGHSLDFLGLSSRNSRDFITQTSREHAGAIATGQGSTGHEKAADDSFPDSSHTSLSLSSGELLTKLDPGRPNASPFLIEKLGSPERLRSTGESPVTLGSNRASPRESANRHGSASEVLGLTAGIDSQSELPVMLYTVQDRESNNTRWSVYEKERRSLGFPQPPSQSYGGLRSGSNSARSISILSRSIDMPFAENVKSQSKPPGVPPTAANIRGLKSPQLSPCMADSAYRGTKGSSVYGSSISSIQGRNSGRYDDNRVPHPGSILLKEDASVLVPNSVQQTRVPSPASSVNQDTVTKQHHHLSMIGHNEKSGQYWQTPSKANAMPWSKWFTMMVMGLVAVPIYFMLSFGFFDYGGYYEFSLDRTLNEKHDDVLVRYFRRYTRSQKVLSCIFGVFWIMVVLAMIGVGFGLAITRS